MSDLEERLYEIADLSYVVKPEDAQVLRDAAAVLERLRLEGEAMRARLSALDGGDHQGETL